MDFDSQSCLTSCDLKLTGCGICQELSIIILISYCCISIHNGHGLSWTLNFKVRKSIAQVCHVLSETWLVLIRQPYFKILLLSVNNILLINDVLFCAC